MGAVSASGAGVAPLWTSCVEGRSSLRPIRGFDAEALGVDRGGEVDLPSVAEDGIDRAAAMAILACDEAIASAGLPASALARGAGVTIGSCLGGALLVFDWLAHGARARPEPPALRGSLAAPALAIAERHRLSGPVSTVSTACASGTGAIALATDAIRRGEADVMLAGGADALSRFVVSGFSQLRALSRGPVRPFDRRRDGLALGEGAAILVLEERATARRRGAPILAEVLGSGRSSDANHMTGPSRTGDGVVRAVEAALRDAAIPADTIGYVNAHGTGTPFNDRMETIAFRRALGERALRVPVSSIKPIVGHTLGAAGAIEAVVCVRAMAEGVVPPTIGYDEPDPECDLDYVPNVARRHSFRCALSSSSAFGGNNAAILLGLP
jgi:3-oxoacyl-[acyl-carrier-protein] synthase II